jgi:VanZ family protein
MTRFWWALGFTLVGIALFLCLVPNQTLPRGFDLNDKLTHALGHAALSAYFTGLVARRKWWKIFILLLAFGVTVELLQHHMDLGRHGDARDVLANSAGDLLGLVLGWLGLSNWPRWMDRLIGARKAT